MRLLIIILICGSSCFAQKPLPTPEGVTATRAGHAFQGSQQQINVNVTFISAPAGRIQTLKPGAIVRTEAVKDKPALVEVSDEKLSESGGIRLVSARKIVERAQPVFVETLAEADVKKLIGKVQQNERSNVMFGPRVTVFDGQRAELRDSVKRPFVVGLKPDGESVTPQIRQVETGTMLDFRAQSKTNGDVRLDLRIRFADVINVSTKKAAAANLSVQVPETETSEVELSAVVPKNHSLVISGAQKKLRTTVERNSFSGIPYVSRMFKNSATATVTEDLLLVITPQLLDVSDAID